MLAVVKAMRFLTIAFFAALLAVGCDRKAKDPFEGNNCINRLRMIDGAKQQWALERHKTTNDIPSWDDIRFYVTRKGDVPACPAGGTYTIGRVDEDPKCSYPHTYR